MTDDEKRLEEAKRQAETERVALIEFLQRNDVNVSSYGEAPTEPEDEKTMPVALVSLAGLRRLRDLLEPSAEQKPETPGEF